MEERSKPKHFPKHLTTLAGKPIDTKKARAEHDKKWKEEELVEAKRKAREIRDKIGWK